MALRHLLLMSLSLALMQPSWASEAPTPSFRDELFDQVTESNWKKVIEALDGLDSVPSEDEEVFKLIRLKAYAELKEWSKLLESPRVKAPLLDGYFTYLRGLAAHESKNFEVLESVEVDSDLPRPLQESLHLFRAKALAQQSRWPEAKLAYRAFLKNFPRSRHQTDVMMELAEIEWKLENRFEALALYERVYTFHPIEDSQNRAQKRLEETGRFQELQTDVHLERAQRLQRAALFSKALQELRRLSLRSEEARPRVELAMARIEFSARNYARSEALSAAALKKEISDREMEIAWRRLLAFSLTRQGKFDEARIEYRKLLDKSIPQADREQAYLRLGFMALSDQKFDEAAEHFGALRTQFRNTRYAESSHWFQAWSLYSHHLQQKTQPDYKMNRGSLQQSVRLLEQLPRLPEGGNLAAQAVYWKAEVQRELEDERARERSLNELNRDWRAAFHSLLPQGKEGFQFLYFDPLYTTDHLLLKARPHFRVADPSFQQAAWRRLELFSKLHFHTWAELELQRFLARSGTKNQGLRDAVAYRLQELGDWSALVRYAQNHFPHSIHRFNAQDSIALYHYPQAYAPEVLKAAKQFKVSPFLIWGVMREESRFQADALSSAGAVGLLQLMPPLASRIARQLRERSPNRNTLTDPSLNIRYATFHLAELVDQVRSWNVPEEFVFPLVVASYNAGSSPVRRWVRELGTDRLDIFVESIPYAETRAYVKRVLQSSQIYYLLYGERVRALATNGGDKKL